MVLLPRKARQQDPRNTARIAVNTPTKTVPLESALSDVEFCDGCMCQSWGRYQAVRTTAYRAARMLITVTHCVARLRACR